MQMHWREEWYYMPVEISKNAELFYRALDDLWCATVTYKVGPNNATWSCCQAVEKVMKGLLNLYDLNDEYTHELGELLRDVEKKNTLSEETVENINIMRRYGNRLRYKNMPTDPTVEDAFNLIKRTQQIVDEFANIKKCALEFQEARDVHNKILKEAKV